MDIRQKALEILAVVLSLVMLSSCAVFAETEVTGAMIAGGTCGDNLIWSLDDNGNLTISGSGEMTDYDQNANIAPWKDYTIKSVVAESGVKTIGNDAFSCCKELITAFLSEGITIIGDNAFASCENLKLALMPSSVTKIGSSVFAHCKSLPSVTIPSNVTTIGSSAFSYCESLASVTIPGTVKTIDSNTFAYCTGLVSAIMLEGVETIGNDAFRHCESLKLAVMPSGVTSIGKGAFLFCGNLASVRIPLGVTDIGTQAFSGCTDIIVHMKSETPPALGENAFGITASKILVPAAAVDAYKTADGWKNYADIIFAEEQEEDNAIVLTESNVFVQLVKPQKAMLIVASYGASALKDMKVIPLNTLTYENTLADMGLKTEGADKVKAFLWSDMINLISMCEAQEITLYE